MAVTPNLSLPLLEPCQANAWERVNDALDLIEAATGTTLPHLTANPLDVHATLNEAFAIIEGEIVGNLPRLLDGQQQKHVLINQAWRIIDEAPGGGGGGDVVSGVGSAAGVAAASATGEEVEDEIVLGTGIVSVISGPGAFVLDKCEGGTVSDTFTIVQIEAQFAGVSANLTPKLVGMTSGVEADLAGVSFCDTGTTANYAPWGSNRARVVVQEGPETVTWVLAYVGSNPGWIPVGDEDPGEVVQVIGS